MAKAGKSENVIEEASLTIEELGKLKGLEYNAKDNGLKDKYGKSISGELIDISSSINRWSEIDDPLTELLTKATWGNKAYCFPEEEIIEESFGKIFPGTLEDVLFLLEAVGHADRENSFLDICYKNSNSNNSDAVYVDISPSVFRKSSFSGDRMLCDITNPSELRKIAEFQRKKKNRSRTVAACIGHTLANLPPSMQKKVFHANSMALRPGDIFLAGVRTIEYFENSKNYGRMIEGYSQESNKEYIMGLLENALTKMNNSQKDVQKEIQKFIREDSEFAVLYDNKKDAVLSCAKYPKTAKRYLILNRSQRFKEEDIRKANGRLFPHFREISFFYDNKTNPTCMVVSCMKESIKEKMERYAKKGMLFALMAAMLYGSNQLYDAGYYKKLNGEYNASPDKLEYLLKKKPNEIIKVAGENEIKRFIAEDIEKQNKKHFLYNPNEENERMKVISCALNENFEEFISTICRNKSSSGNYLGILKMQQPKMKDLTELFNNAYTASANDAEKVVSKLNFAYYESMRSRYEEAIKVRAQAKRIIENSKFMNDELKGKCLDKIWSENIIDMTYNIETGKVHEELRKQITEEKINPLLKKSVRTEKETECLAAMYFNRGRLNFRDKRYGDAEKDLEKALKFGTAIRNDANHELADLFYEQAKYKESIKLCDGILSTKIGANTDAWTSFIRLKSASILNACGAKPANIEKMVEENYQQFREGEINGKGWNRYFKGINYLIENNTKEAHKMFKESYESLDNAKKEADRAKARFQIGRCLYLLKDYPESEQNLKYALSIFENRDDNGKDIDSIVYSKEALLCKGYLIKAYEKNGKEEEKNNLLGQFRNGLKEFYDNIQKGKIGNNLAIDTEMGKAELNSIWQDYLGK